MLVSVWSLQATLREWNSTWKLHFQPRCAIGQETRIHLYWDMRGWFSMGFSFGSRSWVTYFFVKPARNQHKTSRQEINQTVLLPRRNPLALLITTPGSQISAAKRVGTSEGYQKTGECRASSIPKYEWTNERRNESSTSTLHCHYIKFHNIHAVCLDLPDMQQDVRPFFADGWLFQVKWSPPTVCGPLSIHPCRKCIQHRANITPKPYN